MCLFKSPPVSIPQVTTTARDLIPSTTTQEPESPILGGDSAYDDDDSTTTKKRGTAALQIKPITTSASYNPVNTGIGKVT